ncbi:uncharacterized protein LY89DRAFT_632023 [Mollisia scopiformis]|uniref:Wax synthase domain-containing protein n=1 Tax=Mollisia scopiformis TaxID=149040 RepID=A0A132B3W5_MOLSC|nr:uncharacterized protein LY89DRAFT_632023 [Mollisia scopiformis]KUJ07021.1 hypothetical protein LY89DRAFT_632023 [Mollisia scopiformis]
MSELLTLAKGLNPWPFFALQLSTSILTLGFTSPSSLFRPTILPFVASCTYITCLNLREFTSRGSWAATTACFSTLFFLQYLEMGVLSRWSFEARGPTSTSSKNSQDREAKKEDTIWTRLKFGTSSMISFRDLYTPHETKNSPHFSPKNPSYTPSRSTFLLTSIPKLVLCYLILDLIEFQPPPPDASSLFSPSKVPFLLRIFSGEEAVTGEDVLVRIASSIGFWISLYCMISGMALFLGVVCVGLGVSEVKEWRPIMGSLSSAYTIRGFWGEFWHQGTRKTFSYPSNYLIDHLPVKLPRLLARYAKIFLTFYVSGVVHVIGDWTGFMPWAESGSVRFFMAQAGGILVEDAVQWVWRTLVGKEKGKGNEKEEKKGGKVWMKIVGFVWVSIFMLFWSTPAWIYPTARLNAGGVEGKVLPFSVIGFFTR